MERELRRLVRSAGEDCVWREVRVPRTGEVLARGVGDLCDALPANLGKGASQPEESPQGGVVSFHGRTVADLGCNLGHHSQMAARQGAAFVVGIERDPRLARAAGVWAALCGVHGVRFHVADLVADAPAARCDMAMMIDTLGKGMVLAGLAPAMLDAVEAYARTEALVSVTPRYPVRTHLEGASARLADMYGSRWLSGGMFLMEEYVSQRLAPRWEVSVVARAGAGQRDKRILYCRRRDSRSAG